MEGPAHGPRARFMTQNIEALQQAGAMALLRPLLLDNVPRWVRCVEGVTACITAQGSACMDCQAAAMLAFHGVHVLGVSRAASSSPLLWHWAAWPATATTWLRALCRTRSYRSWCARVAAGGFAWPAVARQ